MRALCLFLLVGCGGGKANCDNEDLADGAIEGTTSENPWATDITYIVGEAEISLNSGAEGPYQLIGSLRTTTDGENIVDAIKSGDFPFDVDLADSNAGAMASSYGPPGAQLNSGGDFGGFVSFDGLEAGVLTGCYDFDLYQPGTEVHFAGNFRALEIVP